jgi:hypothetical protein
MRSELNNHRVDEDGTIWIGKGSFAVEVPPSRNRIVYHLDLPSQRLEGHLRAWHKVRFAPEIKCEVCVCVLRAPPCKIPLGPRAWRPGPVVD